MEESLIREMVSLCLGKIAAEGNALNTELEFIEVVKNFEATRKKWLYAELELKKNKVLLVKSDVARGALEVKLKHARNQVDVEIKKRLKAETDFQYLQRQMQLMCDILVHDSKSSTCLNDEQRSMLVSFNPRAANIAKHKSKRLSVIDESSFLSHSDISYDRTDEDMDLDTTVVKPLKSRAREKRRSSMGTIALVLEGKRARVGGESGDLVGGRPIEKEMETTIVKASVTTPDSGSQIHMVIDITQETPEKPPRTFRQEHILPSICDQTSVWVPDGETMTEIDTVMELEEQGETSTILEPSLAPVFIGVEKPLKHIFLSKTVIRPETCVPCCKRIRFGKMALKCKDCRVVTHPECKFKCHDCCSPSRFTGHPKMKDTLEGFAPTTHPRIPLLIIQCVNEIEKRGLEERGVYRVPGGESLVRELREEYIHGKEPLMLAKVDEIHVVCGLLKDFLRKLKEPLVTFRLHKSFMDAAEISDENICAATMCQTIGYLPKSNQETLAFLMLHLQKVMRSPLCQMDQNNLARVFGPTIVGHGTSEPSPLTIVRDTNVQPKVITCMLSLPVKYWKSLLMNERDHVISSVIEANINTDNHSTDWDLLFKPLTSPEISKHQKTPSSGSLKGKIKILGHAFNNINKTKIDSSKKKFFTSPC